jgi:antitoxin (DNA-binding transcriptional repressor) of toxin-antitoxin stability system
MDTITTTNLRTQSSQLVNTLKKGSVVSLIHRSKIIGLIKPQKEAKTLTKTDIQQIKEAAKKLHIQKLSYDEREKRYRKQLIDKYGKDIS